MAPDSPEGPETPDPGALSSWQDIEAALAKYWVDIGDEDDEGGEDE